MLVFFLCSCAAVLTISIKIISKQKICKPDSHTGCQLKQENTEDLKAIYAVLMGKKKRTVLATHKEQPELL